MSMSNFCDECGYTDPYHHAGCSQHDSKRVIAGAVSDTPPADKFDFSGLRSHAPSGLRVVAADDTGLQLARTTAARTMNFLVFKTGGEFHLHASNRAFGLKDLRDPQHFVMRSDDLQRILKSLGYGKRRL